jgi:hypothetical protein
LQYYQLLSWLTWCPPITWPLQRSVLLLLASLFSSYLLSLFIRHSLSFRASSSEPA